MMWGRHMGYMTNDGALNFSGFCCTKEAPGVRHSRAGTGTSTVAGPQLLLLPSPGSTLHCACTMCSGPS